MPPTMPASPSAIALDSRWEDLTVIHGIGPAIARKLRHLCEIQTLQDLANCPPDFLEQRLQKTRPAIARSLIEKWIHQAQVCIQAPPAGWLTVGSFVIDLQRSPGPGPGPVSYRAIAHHPASNTIRIFSDLQGDRLYEWMRQYFAEPEPTPAPPPTETTSPPWVVEIRSLKITSSQRPAHSWRIDALHRQISTPLHHQEPFSLEMGFALGLNQLSHSRMESLPCEVQIYAHHRATGKVEVLGNFSLNLRTPQPFYTAILNDLILSQPGLYRLNTLISLPGISSLPGYFEVPVLPVV